MAELQAVDIVFKVREAGTSDAYKELVCTIDDQLQLTNDVTETNTRCGTKIGVSEAKGTLSGNATCNISPTSSEVSYDDVAGYQIDRTNLDYEYKNEAFTDEDGNSVAEGAVLNFSGTGKFVDTTFTGADKDVAKFSFQFKPSTITKA